MNNKLLITTLTLLVLIFGCLLMYERYAFQIKYKVCDVAYSNCFVIAKFDDLNSCESAREKGEWYCDTITDPLKPNCRVEKSNISTSFCSE